MKSDNAMRAFVSVVEEQGFSAAARLLGVPTSTISRQIGRLEDRLDARLLNRTTRSLTPTDVGQRYYERCKRIVSDIAEAEDEIRDMQSTPRGRLRLSMPPSSRDLPLAQDMICAFMAAYPEVEVEVTAENRFVDLIAEGIDVAIRAGQLKDSNLVARRFIDSELGVVASADYLTRHGTPETVDDLREHQCLAAAAFGEPGRPKWPTTSGRSVAITPRLTSNDLGLIASCVANGQGIAFLPLMFLASEIDEGRVVRILRDDFGFTTSASLVYPSSRYVSARVRAFVDFALAYARDHG